MKLTGGQGGEDCFHRALAQLGVGEQAAGGVGDVEDVDRLGAERLDACGLDVQAALAEGTAEAPQQAALVVVCCRHGDRVVTTCEALSPSATWGGGAFVPCVRPALALRSSRSSTSSLPSIIRRRSAVT